MTPRTTVAIDRTHAMVPGTATLNPRTNRSEVLLPLDGTPVSVRSLPIRDLRSGQVLKVLSELEATNDVIGPGPADYSNAEADVRLVLAHSPADTTGIELTLAARTTITWLQHHRIFTDHGVYVAPSDLGDRFLNVVVRARHARVPTRCWSPPREGVQVDVPCRLDVEHQYGSLAAIRYSSAADAPPGSAPFSASVGEGRAIALASELPTPERCAASPCSYLPVIALSRPLGNLGDGDILESAATLQVDATDLVGGDHRCNIMVAGRLLLSDSPVARVNDYPLTGSMAMNLTGWSGHAASARSETGLFQRIDAHRLSAAMTGADRSRPPRYLLLEAWTSPNVYCDRSRRVRIHAEQSDLTVVSHRRRSSTGTASEPHAPPAGSGITSQTLPEVHSGDSLQAFAQTSFSSGTESALVGTRLALDGTRSLASPAATALERLGPDHGTLPGRRTAT
ncbi:MAG TPA: hypothetical protein VNT32_09460, partial [Thermoleophilaceae bacterium]|nr:hypothetical protein [Thermoleophilaceae bacterium]